MKNILEKSRVFSRTLLIGVIVYLGSLAIVANVYALTFNYVGKQSTVSGTEKSLGVVSVIVSLDSGIIVSGDEVHNISECDRSMKWENGCFTSDFISFGLPKAHPEAGERWEVGKFVLKNDGSAPFFLNGRKIDACLISEISQELGLFRTIYYVRGYGIVAFVAHASSGDEAYLVAP